MSNVHFLFDWGNTLMRVLPRMTGPMCDWPRVEAMPHAATTLARLSQSAPCHLATNARDSEPEQIRRALLRGGLGRFITNVYCLRVVGWPKPSAEFFAHVLEDLRVPGQRVVMVGDDLDGDVRGALASGLCGIWYNRACLPSPPGVRSIEDLLELAPAQ